MTTRIHRWLLGLMLLLLMPGTFLACLCLIGAIGSGLQHGFQAIALVAIPILLVPPMLIWWGLRMLLGLGQGFHHKLRRHLLAFYLTVLVYGLFWLFSTVSHGSDATWIFPKSFRITGSPVLILPVLITLFTKPEEKREWNPRSGGIRPNRWSDRLIALLASRIR